MRVEADQSPQVCQVVPVACLAVKGVIRDLWVDGVQGVSAGLKISDPKGSGEAIVILFFYEKFRPA